MIIICRSQNMFFFTLFLVIAVFSLKTPPKPLKLIDASNMNYENIYYVTFLNVFTCFLSICLDFAPEIPREIYMVLCSCASFSLHYLSLSVSHLFAIFDHNFGQVHGAGRGKKPPFSSNQIKTWHKSSTLLNFMIFSLRVEAWLLMQHKNWPLSRF